MKALIRRKIAEIDAWLGVPHDQIDWGTYADECLAMLTQIERAAIRDGFPQIVTLVQKRGGVKQTKRVLAACLATLEKPAELLTLSEAAEILSLQPAGLRKIKNQGRIRFQQNGNGPIKFRREWLDEYQQSTSPNGVKRSPAQRRAPVPQSAVLGFNPSLFKS